MENTTKLQNWKMTDSRTKTCRIKSIKGLRMDGIIDTRFAVTIETEGGIKRFTTDSLDKANFEIDRYDTDDSFRHAVIIDTETDEIIRDTYNE